MTLNDLGSPQARQLLEANIIIIAPIRTLHDEPMAELRTVLQSLAAEPAPPEDLSTKARELQEEEEIVNSMDRILAQMAQWESFVDMLNHVRQIIKLQNSVLESTARIRKERTKDLFDE